MPIIAAAPNARAATGPETWDAEMRVRYLPPVPPTLPALAAVSSVMTPVVSPAPPMVPPPPGMMPSSPAGIENPQFDEGPPDNELHQPWTTHAATRACTTMLELLATHSSTSPPLLCQTARRANFRSPILPHRILLPRAVV